jgi:hypothetical protein
VDYSKKALRCVRVICLSPLEPVTPYLSNVSLEDDFLKVYQPEAVVGQYMINGSSTTQTQAKDYSNRSYYWSLHVISSP